MHTAGSASPAVSRTSSEIRTVDRAASCVRLLLYNAPRAAPWSRQALVQFGAAALARIQPASSCGLGAAPMTALALTFSPKSGMAGG